LEPETQTDKAPVTGQPLPHLTAERSDEATLAAASTSNAMPDISGMTVALRSVTIQAAFHTPWVGTASPSKVPREPGPCIESPVIQSIDHHRAPIGPRFQSPADHLRAESAERVHTENRVCGATDVPPRQTLAEATIDPLNEAVAPQHVAATRPLTEERGCQDPLKPVSQLRHQPGAPGERCPDETSFAQDVAVAVAADEKVDAPLSNTLGDTSLRVLHAASV